MRSAVENYSLFATSLVANDELVRKSLADAAITELKVELTECQQYYGWTQFVEQRERAEQAGALLDEALDDLDERTEERDEVMREHRVMIRIINGAIGGR